LTRTEKSLTDNADKLDAETNKTAVKNTVAEAKEEVKDGEEDLLDAAIVEKKEALSAQQP
jgi:hypothetical protein